MSDLLTSKNTSVGFVEVRQNGTQYELYLNGALRQYSSSLDFIMREFEKLS